MRTNTLLNKWIMIGLIVLISVSACGPQETATPEPTENFPATLTAEAPIVLPPTATYTALPSPTSPPVETAPTIELSPTAVIVYDEDGNPIDQQYVISIDPLGDCYRLAILKTYAEEKFQPGEVFTITWDVQNIGYCEWKPNFQAVWGLGEKMGDGFDTLREFVPAGGTTSFSLQLKAPNTPGAYLSYWHVINLDGYFFGVDLPVSITVIDPNATPSVTPTKKPTKTPAPTKTKAP